MRKIDSRFITRSAIVAALYAALTLILQPISYGPMQFRVSEALTLLPILMPESIPGLFIGCLLANLLGGSTALDIIFGSLATLLAAVLTYALRKNKYVAAAMPVIINGLVVGAVLSYAYALPTLETMAYVALGEAAVVYTLGLLMLRAIRSLPGNPLDL